MANRFALADQAQRIANALMSSVTDESGLQIVLAETQQLASSIKNEQAPNEERLDPTALLYVGDADGCEACDWIDENRPENWAYDWCPFHAGMDQGRAIFAAAVAALNENPDLINGALADAARVKAVLVD